MSSRARSSKPRRRHLGESLTPLIIALSGAFLVHCAGDPTPEPSGGSAGGPAAAGAAGSGTSAGGPSGGTASSAGTPSTSAGSAIGGSSSDAGSAGTDAGGTTQAGSPAGGTPAGGTPSGGTGSSGGSPSCAGDGILCEDFETYAANAAPTGSWTHAEKGAGKILVDTTRAFKGKQSLHVTGRMNQDTANITKAIQTNSETAYVRFMMYATSYPSSEGVHTRLLRIGTPQAAGGLADSSYAFAQYNGTGIEKVNSIYQRDTSVHLSDAGLLNRWNCWEFSIDKTGGIGKVKVQIWRDGKALTLAAAGSPTHGMTSASWDPIPFQTVMLGLDGFQADQVPADYWLDDISITPQRVGCGTAQ